MAVISLFSVQDSLCMGSGLWQPCHICKKSSAMAILCKYPSTASIIIPWLFPIFVVFNNGLLPAHMQLLAQENLHTMTFGRFVMDLLLDNLKPTSSLRRKSWPLVRLHVVWEKIYRKLCWRDQLTLIALCLVLAASQWDAALAIHHKSPSGQCDNH